MSNPNPPERRSVDRRRKWWVRSPQQWYNIALAVVWGANELAEYIKSREYVAPTWFMEALTFAAFAGNFYLRSAKFDNERLTLRNPDKKPDAPES